MLRYLKHWAFITESLGTEIDEDTPLADVPPSVKFLLYSHLYPNQSRGPALVMLPGCRDIWMAKLAEQFNFRIVNENVANLLLTHKATLLSSFLSIDQTSVIPSTPQKYTVQYAHDRLVYAATVNVAVSISKSSQRWKSLNLHMSNDGFLYAPRTSLALQDTATYTHHRSDNW